MLHQLLCALQGKTGSIIKKYQTEICVDSTVNYLSKPQIQLINEICKCGFYYHKIMSLINLQLSQSNSFSFVLTKSPSMYRKAMYQGLKTALNQYIDLILSIQQNFLKYRHFTFSNIKSQLQPYEFIMKQITQIIYHVYNQNMKGGSIINFLYNKYSNSNIGLRKWLESMLVSTVKVFLSQINMWIFYGEIQDFYGEFFIHKVIIESSEKYKFKSKSGIKNIQITDWDMFTLQELMIPTCLINLQTAAKILFIGKSIKILRSANKISSIPDNSILEKIQKCPACEYSQVIFQGAIEQIRQIIARKMIQFIMKEQNLIKQLQKLNSYYLMFKGDFYHHFFEEAKGIQTIAQKQKAQKKINQIYLPNTFIRLSQSQDIKRLYFELKPLGFSYSTFKNFINLCPVGNVDLIEGKSIRFNSTGSAIWNRSKQIIQNNFTMIYTFNFKKIKQITSANKVDHGTQPTYLNLILQNCKQISGLTHQNPSHIGRLGQYVALKVGFQYSQKEKNYISSMLMVTRDIKRHQKQQLLAICQPKGINFLDQKSYSIKFHYSNQTLKAELIGQNNQKSQIKVQTFNISKYIDLQMSRSYLGFIPTINQSDYIVDLEQWQMICKPNTYYNSHWSQLVLNFKIQWPINLIITPDLIQSYSRIHKFMFPIRQLQIEIQSIWIQIPKLIKAQKRATKQQMNELRIFQRNLAALRNQINLVFNNFFSYLQSDIAQCVWSKLIQKLQTEKDFENVIYSVNKYVYSIQKMYFFNTPKIHKKFNQLIQKARSFTIFFNNLITQSFIDQTSYNDLQRIDQEFNSKLYEFHGLLKDLSKFNTSQHLFHLMKRMQSCLNPIKEYKCA